MYIKISHAALYSGLRNHLRMCKSLKSPVSLPSFGHSVVYKKSHRLQKIVFWSFIPKSVEGNYSISVLRLYRAGRELTPLVSVPFSGPIQQLGRADKEAPR